jgi:hypothetical protein
MISKMNIPFKVSNDNTTESVSEITGIAIPSMFEYKIRKRMSIYDELIKNKSEKNIVKTKTSKNKSSKSDSKSDDSKTIAQKYNIDKIILKKMTNEQLLYIANCWNAHKTGYICKIYQITEYDWLNQDDLNYCIDRLTKLNISKNSTFEYKIKTQNEKELLERNLIGYIDCIDKDNNVVYEFKCVQKLDKTHYLQLAIYMYMYEVEKLDTIQKLTDDFNKKKEKMIKKSIEEFLGFRKQIITEINAYEKNYVNSGLTSILDKLRNDLSNMDKLIEERKKEETVKLEKKLNDDLKFYKNKTKYILFNILTNEYITINSELKNLRKLVEFLIYSKYVFINPITDEFFINMNNNIKNIYIK